MKGYTYDPKTRQYRDGAGKLVSAAVILGLRDAIADDAASQTQAATVDYLQGGASLSDWALSMADAIQSSAVAAYLLGRGGSNALQPADHAAIDAMLAPQLAAARAFTLDLAASDASLPEDAPALDENGDFATDENGDVVDANGDPILDSAGEPISAEEAASLWPGVLDLISRARSYETATFAGYSAGQSAAWDGAELPIMPPLHPSCRCQCLFSVADDGEILGTWDAAAGACVICDDAEATYQQYGTGVYVSPDDAGMETESE